MKNLNGKKLLIIGGAFQHCKIVEQAKKLGVETFVTDYLPLEKSPAKKIADHYWMYNIVDYDDIVNACRKEKIDGAIALCLDACQLPYQEICQRLGFACFGNKEQFIKLTDKVAFKKCCTEYGVDIIPEFSEADFVNKETCDKNVEFPIFVKPCDSRGSRGQTICKNYEEARNAIAFAKSESATNKAVIEKYMGNKNDFSMTYVVINGVPYLTRTGSRYLGSIEDKLDRLAIAGSSPSKFTNLYLEKVDKKVQNMIKGIGLKNAPVFMQGFIDGDRIRFYDPGLRFPGIEYERMYEYACGMNPIDALIEFALTGSVSEEFSNLEDTVLLNGKTAVDLLIAVRPGKITEIKGWDKIKNHSKVISAYSKYDVGDIVGEHWNVNQRFCEVDLVGNSIEETKDLIKWVYNTLYVADENGENMVFAKFDPELL